MSQVITTTYPTQDGHAIGHIKLNHPKALNAMNLDMVRQVAQTLTDWQTDAQVVVVVISGDERALCAGGDIKSLWAGDGDAVRSFFEQEYALMYQLHTYDKPVMAWGHGIVMGGGLGLFAGSSHKVVTPDTLMAMPEVSIGLFPDAGGSYFLPRMMGKVGLFLGLTGARFTGVDAYYLGLAQVMCEAGEFDEFLSTLCSSDWQGDPHAVMSRVLQGFHRPKLMADSQILTNIHAINQLMNAGDLRAVDKALRSYTGDSEFIISAIQNYIHGSDTTKALTWRIYHAVKPMSLKEIFKMETAVAVRCVMHGDFKEGVRALLIDKDKNPKWRYGLDEMPVGYIEGFFGSLNSKKSA